MEIPQQFLELSARIGSNPLLVQGPGGNTSVKADGRMWVKASGTELADAVSSDIFVGVSVERAIAELEGAGDGSCRSALLDSNCTLRPSIETTFHALLPQRYVFHFHSVGAIAHARPHPHAGRTHFLWEGLHWFWFLFVYIDFILL